MSRLQPLGGASAPANNNSEPNVHLGATGAQSEPTVSKSPLRLAKRSKPVQARVPSISTDGPPEDPGFVQKPALSETVQAKEVNPDTTSCPSCAENNANFLVKCWNCDYIFDQAHEKQKLVVKKRKTIAIRCSLILLLTVSLVTGGMFIPVKKINVWKYLKLRVYRMNIPALKTQGGDKYLRGEWLGLWGGKSSFHLTLLPEDYYYEGAIDVTYAVKGSISRSGNTTAVNLYPTPKYNDYGIRKDGYAAARNFILSPVTNQPGILHLQARIDGVIKETYLYKISDAEKGKSDWGEQKEWYSIVKLFEKNEADYNYEKKYYLSELDIKVEHSHDYWEKTILDLGKEPYKAGLRKGDILVALEGFPLSDLKGWLLAKRLKKPGDKMEVTVIRNGRELKFSLKARL